MQGKEDSQRKKSSCKGSISAKRSLRYKSNVNFRRHLKGNSNSNLKDSSNINSILKGSSNISSLLKDMKAMMKLTTWMREVPSLERLITAMSNKLQWDKFIVKSNLTVPWPSNLNSNHTVPWPNNLPLVEPETITTPEKEVEVVDSKPSNNQSTKAFQLYRSLSPLLEEEWVEWEATPPTGINQEIAVQKSQTIRAQTECKIWWRKATHVQDSSTSKHLEEHHIMLIPQMIQQSQMVPRKFQNSIVNIKKW